MTDRNNNELPDVVKYLLGEGTLNGRWLSDYTGEIGQYWWRKHLRECFTARVQPKANNEPCVDLDDALRAFQDGEISIGRMREIARLWANGKPFELPELKPVERIHICGVSCKPNGENCNGYCIGKQPRAATYLTQQSAKDNTEDLFALLREALNNYSGLLQKYKDMAEDYEYRGFYDDILKIIQENEEKIAKINSVIGDK